MQVVVYVVVWNNSNILYFYFYLDSGKYEMRISIKYAKKEQDLCVGLEIHFFFPFFFGELIVNCTSGGNIN